MTSYYALFALVLSAQVSCGASACAGGEGECPSEGGDSNVLLQSRTMVETEVLSIENRTAAEMEIEEEEEAEGEEGEDEGSTREEVEVSDIPITGGECARAKFRSLDNDDSDVEIVKKDGRVETFQNVKGTRTVHEKDVFTGDSGDGQSTMNMVKYGGHDIFASIVDAKAGKVCKIAPDADDNIRVICVNETDFPEDEPPFALVEPNDYELLQNGLLQVDESENADDGSVIDVMVVWTHWAECANSGKRKKCTLTAQTKTNMEGQIDLAIQESNTALDLSGVYFNLRLVHKYLETGYFEQDITDALTALATMGDNKLDGVFAKREQYKADLVSLVSGASEFCGKGFLGPKRDRMFTVVSYTCLTGYYSFLHEIGHNMGCMHDRANANECESTGVNYGYRAPDASFRTIMSYDCTSKPRRCASARRRFSTKVASKSCTRIQRISNSNSKYRWDNQLIGNSGANNAKWLNDVRRIVAQYYNSNGAASGSYRVVTSSSIRCAPITSLSECNTAAAALGFLDTTASDDGTRRRSSGVTYDPPYCYFEENELKYNSNGNNKGACSPLDQCLCKKQSMTGR